MTVYEGSATGPRHTGAKQNLPSHAVLTYIFLSEALLCCN